MKPGDSVRMKSGGPLMSVEEMPVTDGVEHINCVWFEDQGGVWALRRAAFIQSVLKLDE